jgi:hypothetical protein
MAVKPVLLDPAGTVTDAGTVTALLLLDRPITSPPLPAAALNVTVQASLPDPVNELELQLSPLSAPAADCPVPLRLIAAVVGDALSETVTLPLAAPVTVGSKVTASVAVWPGFRVTGKDAPDMLNPAPLRVAELIVSGAVPEEVSVTDCGEEDVLTVTLPKFRLAVLICIPATYAPRLMP